MLHNRHNSETWWTYYFSIIFGLMASDQHLVLKVITLRPSDEWTPPGNGWMVARVAEGCGYWMHDGTARELNAGDGFVVGGNACGLLRSSQLGPLRLQFFSVQPQYLNGLMSVAEWQHLEVASVSPLKRVSIFSATESVAQKFLQIVDLPHDHGLWQRCAMLQIWSGALQDLLDAPVTEAAVGSKLNKRVRNLIGKMTEAELADASLADLAAQVNCCTRQFSRLFRKEFGVTFHSRQIELRLQRAHQLLADSDTQVRNIAFASGYRHLGLFNAMFKKRFGVTPSQWRQQNGARNLSQQTWNHFSSAVPE
jgi:AraC-like DNA-binding protein